MMTGDHDHMACQRAALERAEGMCLERGARFTRLRRRVLEVLWQDHRPTSAYELLRRLNDGGGCAAPVAVYRSLEFLIAQGLAHRLPSLNAYVGCSCPETHLRGSGEGNGQWLGVYFLLCGQCGDVVEAWDSHVLEAIQTLAGREGFDVGTPAVEISGVCGVCRKRAAVERDMV